MNISDLIIKKDGYIEFAEPIEKYDFNGIVTCNEDMVATIHLLNRVVSSDVSIVINGETGTGKELYAEYIHAKSNRSNKPYVKLNCATISESLFESEMFGYDAGSFTGALKYGKKGLFEIADTGTIFLDEIAEMPMSVQSKFLRVLQEKQYIRVGGYEQKHADVRIVVATNKDLSKMVEAGEFREDLYYRLDVIRVDLVPLRERQEDIVLLSLYFMNAMNQKYSLDKKMGLPVLEAFWEYDWPGNIRQLQHMIERMMLLSSEPVLRDISVFKKNLPVKDILYKNKSQLNIDINHEAGFDNTLDELMPEQPAKLKDIVTRYEISVIKQYIGLYGSIRKAAKALGVAPSVISRKLSAAEKGEHSSAG